MNFHELFVCVILGIAFINNHITVCDSAYVIHYEEIGCVPIFKKPGSCSPIRYDCSQVINDLNRGLCVYMGKCYKQGEYVNSFLEPCTPECICTKDENNKPTFICQIMDCAKPPELEKGCHFKQEFGKCCVYDQICEPFTEEQKCEVNGTTYIEGEYFSLHQDSCKRCICQRGFKGKYEPPFCQETRCYIGLYNSFRFMDYCAPVYSEQYKCCPSDWRCKSRGQYENVGDKYNGYLGKNECRFGDRRMKKGTKFDIIREKDYDPVINCECIIPPLATCLMRQSR